MLVLESLQRGCCVVASAVGGIPEQIDDGRTGLLTPPGDVAALRAALVRVLDDPALAQRLGAHAANAMTRWMTPAAHACAMLSHYESCCTNKPIPSTV